MFLFGLAVFFLSWRRMTSALALPDDFCDAFENALCSRRPKAKRVVAATTAQAVGDHATASAVGPDATASAVGDSAGASAPAAGASARAAKNLVVKRSSYVMVEQHDIGQRARAFRDTWFARFNKRHGWLQGFISEEYEDVISDKVVERLRSQVRSAIRCVEKQTDFVGKKSARPRVPR